MLTILSEKKRRAFYESQIGKQKKVLWEYEVHDEWRNGFTENYVKVKTPVDAVPGNTIEYMQLSEIDKDGIVLAQATALVQA